MARSRVGRLTGCGVAAAAVIVLGGWLRAGEAPTAEARLDSFAAGSAPSAALDAPIAGASAFDGGPAMAAGAGARRVQSFLVRGWLRGTEVDGDWGVWQADQLAPSASLRRRFDYLLSGVGEVTLDDLRQWVAGEVAAAHGSAGAGAVLAVWDAYVALRRDHPEAAFDIDDAESWRRALAERTRERSAALGPAWAYAFFADDDRRTGNFVEQRAAAKAAPAVGVGAPDTTDPTGLLAAPEAPLSAAAAAQRDARRTATYGADAAARMRLEDAAWDDWQQRLADTRERLRAIDADAQLSALQRGQQREALLTSRYHDGELMRARALLDVRER